MRLSGYTLANCYCRTRIAHGGVSLFVRNNIQFKQRHDLQNLCVQYHIEFTAIEILYCKLIIIVLYRTGKGNFDIYVEKLELLLNRLTDENKRFLIVGDHNVHYSTDNILRRRVDDVLGSYGCVNTITFPTRVTAGSASSIDCGIANYVRDCLTVSPVDTAISDHNAQRYEFAFEHEHDIVNGNKNNFVERRLFSAESFDSFYSDISNYNFNYIYDMTLDINTKFLKLFNILTYYIDIHFPIKKK